jgi:cyanophycinase-like exopeptidase
MPQIANKSSAERTEILNKADQTWLLGGFQAQLLTFFASTVFVSR